MNSVQRLLCVGFVAGLAAPALVCADPTSSPVSIQHHQLALELVPESHALAAVDRITLSGGRPGESVVFSLAPTLQVDRIEDVTQCQGACEAAPSVLFERSEGDDRSGLRPLIATLPTTMSQNGSMQLRIVYRGTINDPPRDPRHLRFVTPSETSGHIGPEGVYLSSESQWYPDVEGSLATYDVAITVPEGWTAVTQGSPQPDSTQWVVASRSEALTVVANRFVVKTRSWRAASGQAIQLATYLFPEEAALSDEYLDASARYLDAYIPILGPYPFSQFAVVENFFPSGLGMPSFTLLGSGVIKRHYIQPYALGHEIVHSWIGNGVFNRVNEGNWVEGLTTYLANYYYHELTGDQAQAREQRRHMLLGYSVYIRSGDDYPVERFSQKHDEKDNAIGYQKSAMVFHLLRQELGDATFWRGIRQLSDRYLGKVAGWKELERLFEEVAGLDLRWFFAQWIERAGAPELAITGLQLYPLHGTAGDPRTIEAVVQVQQAGDAYQAPVDLEFELAGGRRHVVRVRVREGQDRWVVPLSERPLAVRLDPDIHLFRRVARSDMPPMLNLYVTDGVRTVVPPSMPSTEHTSPFTELVQRIMTQEQAKPSISPTTIFPSERREGQLPNGSVLMLGGPLDNVVAMDALRGCGERIRVTESGFTVQGKTYDGPGMALLVSCRRDDQPDSVVTMLYGTSPQALGRVARLLFFYGWQSYVVFQDGAVVARGDWEDKMSPEVRFDQP